MKGRAIIPLLGLLGAAADPQPVDDPNELLKQIKARAEENLTRLPDYICLQTVERTSREGPDEEFRTVDTIRVEVGLIGDRELFAWPDSSHFEDEQLADMIQRGTVGSGDFALHARNVFLSGGPAFTYKGSEPIDGRATHRYDYDVPLSRSTYNLRAPPLQARVPFHGSVWVDAETLDLVRLDVIADEIPPQLGLAEARDRMDYARVEIGSSDFLLPKSAELNMLGLEGNASRNRTTFSGCRQYVGESSISFNAAPAEAPAARQERGVVRLPPHVSLELTLASGIDSRKAAIGDPVEAVLTKPIKDGELILAPRGAVVHGRLVRLEQYDQPIGHYVVGLEFDAVEIGGERTSFTATMRRVTGSKFLVKQSKSLDPSFSKKRKPLMEILVSETHQGQGILHWKADKPVIRDVKMVWEVEPKR